LPDESRDWPTKAYWLLHATTGATQRANQQCVATNAASPPLRSPVLSLAVLTVAPLCLCVLKATGSGAAFVYVRVRGGSVWVWKCGEEEVWRSCGRPIGRVSARSDQLNRSVSLPVSLPVEQ